MRYPVAFVVVLSPACAAPAPTAGPLLFEAGTVSTSAPEFAITFTPDGNTLYFNRASEDRRELTILESRRTGDRWDTPAPASFSGRWRDVDPFVAPDGQRLYFSSDRPRRGGTEPGPFSTWYVERTRAGTWGAPIDPGAPLNSDSSDVFFSISSDGTAAFTSNRDGVSRIYVARADGDAWSIPEPVAFGGSAEGGNPLIAPNGRFMILVAAGPEDRADLHLSCLRGGGWEAPRPLTAANSRYADFAPALGPAGDRLYFTSERPGIVPAVADSVRPPGDIYQIPLADAGASCGDDRSTP